MHKCEYPYCRERILNKYKFCIKHKDTPYYDICKIHGKQVFVAGVCQKCKSMHYGIYRIYYRDGKYFHNRNKKPIPKDSWLKPWLRILANKNISYHKRREEKEVTASPGVYGIFVGKKCLYIGQSVNVQRRKGEHYKCIEIADKHLKRLKKKSKYKSLSKLLKRKNAKVSWKYYKIANNYSVDNLTFKQLVRIKQKEWNSLTKYQRQTLLSYFEQLMMDIHKPTLNIVKARNSNF